VEFYQQLQLLKFRILSITEQIFEPPIRRQETSSEILDNENTFDCFYNTPNYLQHIFVEEIECTSWNWYIEKLHIFFEEYFFHHLFQTHPTSLGIQLLPRSISTMSYSGTL
jgi:hypothetical protein